MATSDPPPPSPVQRFARSMQIDHEKWREGIGYDLDALEAATPRERAAIEEMLLARMPGDWRDVEALAWLDTPRAHAALARLVDDGPVALQLAVLQYRSTPLPEAQRSRILVRALAEADFYAGLTQALDLATVFHPAPVVEALWRGLATRDGPVAVHFAATLFFVHGLSRSRFDWAERPFFLRFHCERGAARDAAIAALRERVAAGPAEPGAGDK